MTTKYRVLFSMMAPREGYIDVDATSVEEATKIVNDLMKENYTNLVIAQVLPIEVATETPPKEVLN